MQLIKKKYSNTGRIQPMEVYRAELYPVHYLTNRMFFLKIIAVRKKNRNFAPLVRSRTY